MMIEFDAAKRKRLEDVTAKRRRELSLTNHQVPTALASILPESQPAEIGDPFAARICDANFGRGYLRGLLATRDLWAAIHGPEEPQQAPQRDLRPWPVSSGPASVEKIPPALRRMIREAIDEKRYPILVHGPKGVGKTCASACVYRLWPAPALWFECGTLLSDVMTCRMSSGQGKAGAITRTNSEGQVWHETEQNVRDKFAASPLVILNDLARRKPTEAQCELLMSLVDSRLGRPLIVTTNLDTEQLAAIDDRLADRLMAGTVIHVVGDSRRGARSKFVRVKGNAPPMPHVSIEEPRKWLE